MLNFERVHPKLELNYYERLDSKFKCLPLFKDAPQIQLCAFILLPYAILFLLYETPLDFLELVNSSKSFEIQIVTVFKMSSLTSSHR